ncbi:MAG: hypothetical protein U0K60_10310 [Parafannyhessea umbonata]|nr:hypothetical protein [Parafannyhessea umbonata]
MQQQYERQTRYNKANTTTVLLRLNKRTDADIIGRLQEVGNKQGYVKSLIRRDMQDER